MLISFKAIDKETKKAAAKVYFMAKNERRRLKELGFSTKEISEKVRLLITDEDRRLVLLSNQILKRKVIFCDSFFEKD